MIIKEEDDEDDEEDTKKKNGNNKKRKRSDEDEDEEEPINNGKVRKGPAVKKQKLNAAGQVGEMYASKYAAGDMKKPGRPDPYAYIKLDPKFLNKRYAATTTPIDPPLTNCSYRRRHVAHQQFENIVKGAKKGAKTKPKRR
jgi:ribosomal RNA-processing protein 12